MNRARVSLTCFAAVLLFTAPARAADREPPTSAPAAAEVLPNGRSLLPNVISGGQPSTEQLAAAQAAGYKTVINLRRLSEPGEKREGVEALGMAYMAIPIDGEAGLTEENARAFSHALETAERPAIVHCGSGNRVGALFALRAYYVESKSLEEAMNIGKAAGLSGMKSAVRAHLEQAEQAP